MSGDAFDAPLQCICDKKLTLRGGFGFRQEAIRPVIEGAQSISRFNRKNTLPGKAIMPEQRRLERRPTAFLRMKKNNAGFIARRKSVSYIPKQSH